MPKSNKILTHKDQDSEYDKQRTNMGVRSGPKLPDRGQINVMTEDGTFNTSSGWTVTPGSLGDSDNWSISNGVATIDGSQSGTRWMIMDFPQNNYYKVIMTITRTAGTLSLSYATGGATSGTEMTNSGTYTHGPHQVTGNDILYIRADSSFNGTVTDVKVIQTDANGVPVSHLLMCLDAMNAKSFAGEPVVNYMQWQNGYPQGWTANSDNNDTDGYKRVWYYNSGSDSRSFHCKRIRKVDSRKDVLHFALRNKTANDLRWFLPLVGIPKSDKTSAFLLTYDYKVLINNSTGSYPVWYAAGYSTTTMGGGFADLDLTNPAIGSLVDFDSNEQAIGQAVIPTTVGTGVADLGGGWYRRTITIAANTFVESGSDGDSSGSGGTGVYGRFGIYTGWGSLGDYSFLMHNIQLLKGNTVGAPVALGGLGSELITNGNIETTTGTGTSGITNWTYGGAPDTGSGRSTTSHEGTYSAALVVDSSGSDCNIQQASVFPAGSAGKTFEITFWARVDSGTSSTSGPQVALYLDGSTTASTQYLTTTWKKCLYKFTKSSHGQTSFIIKRSNGTTGRTIYIDQVSVREILCARNATDGWKDISGNGNHGTFSSTDFGDSGDSDFRRYGNIILPASTDIASNPASINFDGSNDLITTSFGSGRNVYTSPTTFVAWVKSDTTTANKMWLDHGSNGSNQRLYCALITADNPNIFGIQSQAWGYSSNADTSKWYHQALVMDSGTARGYYDGNAAGTKNYTSYTLPGNVRAGGRSSYNWDGQIACFAIYNTALSHADIKQIYNAQKNRFGL